ncbi:eukaryotic translation initiation factor 3 subunit A [Rhizoctonia solani]|nr:eukaryotic translation initiation factor 3 subunit A [Rhizoctonia solani]QRW22779.1 eukaryotic translation initiation factor 3 subunit A [Rhizoctonia solani]
MAPYTKPEAVLKQAEGLISVGQQSAALQSLTEMFSSKRFRTTPLASLEPIVLRFLELCVDLRKGRTAKEGLMQYKNIAQNTSVASIESVVKKFIQLADAKVQEAQEKADQLVAVDDVDDLEATETPENVLLSAVSGDQNKDRTDRALVTPWLKFLWESYRTALETLKNNARLEAIYQQIAAQAFRFCLKHTRKVEFRRLCETLRLHLANVAKYVNQAYSINLADPDTLQRHLDTRFAQLNTSVELELWQEAFRSVEDIHNLLTMAKKAPRPAMMANYYEKLTKIFLTSGNALFHAAAWARYYSVLRAAGGGGKTEEEMSRLAGQVLVSALAVPVGVESEEESSSSRRNNTRLTALLGLSKPPTRAGLLKDALARNTLKLSPASVRSLHNLLEVTFQPLTLCESVAPIVAQLAQDPSYAPYLPLVHRAVLSRLFTQLSEVYSSVRTSHIYELVAPLNANITPDTPGLNSEAPYTPERIELFVMGCAKRGELRVLVEHIEGNVTFVEESLPRTRVSELARALHTSLLKIAPPPSAEESATEKFAALVKGAQEDRRRLLIQRAVVARRRELATELQMRREREEASRRADTVKRERLEEEHRAQQERREKERARVQKEIENVRKEEARKLAEQLKARGNLKINDVELEEMDTTKLIQLQVSQIDREKKELNDKQRIISKRVDHIERALRKAEIPLLEQDYERQQADDKAAHEASNIATITNAEQAHREAVETKQRLARMMNDYNDLRRKIAGQREVELQKKKAEMKEKIDNAKAARREKVLKEREEARLAEEARKKEEEQRAAEQARLEESRRAEEEAKRAEEEAVAAAAAAKRETQLEARRKEQEAALAKLKYEEEAEKRREERRRGQGTPGATGTTGAAGTAGTAGTASPRPNGADSGAGAWRSKAAASASASTPPSAPSTPAASGGKWVPPGRRAAAAEPPASTGSPGSPSPAAAASPAAGGWRAREAARAAAAAAGTGGSPNPSSTPDQQPSTPATDNDGFQTVPSQAKWRPSRGRGSGFGSAGRS